MEDEKAKCDIKELQVRHELGQLDHALEQLHKTIDTLTERLRCVSRDPGAVIKTEEIEKAMELVEIAQAIKNKKQSVDGFNSRLSDTLSGLEI